MRRLFACLVLLVPLSAYGETLFRIGNCCDSDAGTNCRDPLVVCDEDSDCSTYSPYTACSGSEDSEFEAGGIGCDNFGWPPAFSACLTEVSEAVRIWSEYNNSGLTCSGFGVDRWVVRTGLFSWDTSSLPENIAITGCTLRIIPRVVDDDATTTPQLVGGWLDWGGECDATDFYPTPTPEPAFSAMRFNEFEAGVEETITLSNCGNVSTSGVTYLSIYPDSAFPDPGGEAQVAIYQWGATAANQNGPALGVEYVTYTPTDTPTTVPTETRTHTITPTPTKTPTPKAMCCECGDFEPCLEANEDWTCDAGCTPVPNAVCVP